MDQALADIGIISAYRFADDGSALAVFQHLSPNIRMMQKPFNYRVVSYLHLSACIRVNLQISPVGVPEGVPGGYWRRRSTT
jgi:hypothetical protein